MKNMRIGNDRQGRMWIARRAKKKKYPIVSGHIAYLTDIRTGTDFCEH